MRGRRRAQRARAALLTLALLLSGCGGSGSGSSGPVGVTPTPSPAPTPTPSGTCSLRARQDWAFAQIKQWYLFPDTLPSVLDPSAYSTLSAYVDALTANARAQGKDRYFTYVTSIAEEDAYYASGETAGFGVRLVYNAAGQTLMLSEVFEGSAASAAGLRRGAEIIGIGTTAETVTSVASLLATGGTAAVANALGPDTAGTQRVLQIRDSAGTRLVALTKADYTIAPIPADYGMKILTGSSGKIGYVNLRTFILPAEDALRSAFAQFKAQGIDQFIVDLRYNGGGLVSVAQTFASLLGGDRRTSDIFAKLVFRPEKSSENESYFFAPESGSVAARKIAFIGFEGTASASEMLANGFVPYLHDQAILVGSNTYGKPVGQIALDLAECDDRLRLIAFAVQNSAGRGDYYSGLAPVVEMSCAASDSLSAPLGDPSESATAQAIRALNGESCTPIAGASASATAAARAGPFAPLALEALPAPPAPLMPERPSTPQRETPGLF